MNSAIQTVCADMPTTCHNICNVAVKSSKEGSTNGQENGQKKKKPFIACVNHVEQNCHAGEHETHWEKTKTNILSP